MIANRDHSDVTLLSIPELKPRVVSREGIVLLLVLEFSSCTTVMEA